MKNPLSAILLLVAFFTASANDLLNSPQYPHADQQGGDYITAERSIRFATKEKVLTVPSAYWRGGCVPTTVAMILMYWETLGYTDAIPNNNGFDFHSAQNIAAIASQENYSDYFYPKDTQANILSDRSEQAGYTRPDNCIADVLNSSRSASRLSSGATYSNTAKDRLPRWVKSNNPSYDLSIRQYSISNSENSWSTLVSEIDAGRPLIAHVNSSKANSAIDHAVAVIGYGEENGVKFYYALNTWDHKIHRYKYGTENEVNQWGMGALISFNLSVNAPTASLQRFFNRSTGAYFFSANVDEVNHVKQHNPAWTYLGKTFKVETMKTLENVPVYRFYNAHSASHFYTASEAEKNQVQQTLSHYLSYEGVAFYARPTQPDGFKPVYRFFLPGTSSHYFTISESEKNRIVATEDPNLIRYEGVAWFGKE